MTRETTRLRAFLAEQGGEMVVKPLDGSGGFGVFHVRKGDPNTGAILEQATQPGPPLDDGAEVPARGAQGRQAHPAGRRRAAVRGAARAARPTTRAATCTSARKPMATKLDERDTRDHARARRRACARHGQFFVGLDVIGGWLTEINVTSPTGILEANTLYGDTYEVKVVERLEQKTRSTAAHDPPA